MKKEDEIEFWEAINAIAEVQRGIPAKETADLLGLPEGRSAYLLGKWAENGLIDYGTSIRYVWLTAKGEVTEFQ